MQDVTFTMGEFEITMMGAQMFLNDTLVHTFDSPYDSPYFNEALFKELVDSIIFIWELT